VYYPGAVEAAAVRAPYVLALACALVALGCDDSRRRYDAGPIAARDAGRDGSSSGSGLRIVELTTSSEALTEGEDVLVQARLEDPDGLDDIVSIFVLDDDTVVSSLGPTPTFGLYEGRVAWSQLHEASPIELVGSSSRALSVRVTDGVGNTDERAFTLRLQCGDAPAVRRRKRAPRRLRRRVRRARPGSRPLRRVRQRLRGRVQRGRLLRGRLLRAERVPPLRRLAHLRGRVRLAGTHLRGGLLHGLRVRAARQPRRVARLLHLHELVVPRPSRELRRQRRHRLHPLLLLRPVAAREQRRRANG